MGRPLRLDEHSADRLLGGTMAADDAPPGYGPVARFLDTAAAGLDGPASSEAPADAGERGTVAAMQAAVLGRVVSVPEPKRRDMRPTTLFAPRAAAVAAAVALGGGTAAAAFTGNLLPGQASPRAGTSTGVGVASSHAEGTHADNSANPYVATSPPSSVPADQNAAFGLCTAFLAGRGPGSNASPPPFAGLDALATQQNESTTAYCQGVVANHPGGNVSPSADQPSVGAGNSSSHAPVATPNPGGTSTANAAGGGAGANGAGTASTASGGASNQGTSTASTAGGNGASTANGASNGASSQGSGNASTHTSH